VIAFDPATTYVAALAVQALHLLHHRLAKRHISFVEVIGCAILAVPPTLALPDGLFYAAHLGLIAIQFVGSLWIGRLSPDWDKARV
jgi:hypothetical protein